VVRITWDPKAYAAWFDSALGRRVWVDEYRALSEVLDPVDARRVLDAGCGDGRLSVELARERASVVGVDRDLTMLGAAHARMGGSSEVALVRADVSRLPFDQESFDVVTAVTVLCFVPHPAAVVRELARVVRTRGQVVLGELGRWSLWAARRRLRGLVRGGVWASARFWTASELRGLLRDAGLVPGPARGAVFYPRSARAARAIGEVDARLGRLTTLGAAFIAIAGRKPTQPRTGPDKED